MPLHTSQPRTETNVSQAAEVAYRGTTKTFEFGFWQDDDRTVPITPGDPTTYPRVQIIDPDGEVFLTANPPNVAPSAGIGYWKYDFHVPVDADITGVGDRWEFAAEIVTSNGRREAYRTAFTVHDPAVVKQTNSSRFYAVIRGKGVRIQYRSVTRLYHLELEIPVGTSLNTFLLERATVGTGPYDIKEVQGEDGIWVYYIDIPYSKVTGFTKTNLECGQWQVYWTVMESATDAGETVYQFIEVLDRAILGYVPDVRFVVDKLEKRHQSKQSLSDADIFSGILRGIELVNGTFPVTTWGPQNIPSMFKVYVVMGAAYFIYCGQLGLAVDLQFNFSGQTTVLDQDQTGGIESMLERYRGELREQLKESKTDALRHMRPVGTVATRPTRARHLYNTVFKVSSASSNTMLGFLNSIGLI